MEKLFKNLRNSDENTLTFASELFRPSRLFLKALDLKSQVCQEIPSPVIEEVVDDQPMQSEEKVTLVDSLQTYVEKNVEAEEPPVLKFGGGEIKSNAPQKPLFFYELDEAVEDKESKRVLFLSDFKRGDSDGLASDSYELLIKMIQAMNLTDSSSEFFLLYPNTESKNAITDDDMQAAKENVAKFIVSHKCDYVVPLGVIATHLLLDKKDRLTKLRGQFYSRKIIYSGGESLFRIMPIFHPDFLIINPSMKTTTWNDLKKIMQELSLL